MNEFHFMVRVTPRDPLLTRADVFRMLENSLEHMLASRRTKEPDGTSRIASLHVSTPDGLYSTQMDEF